MQVIYKYSLELKERQTINLPADSEILSIQVQGGDICAWVSLDTEKPEREKTLVICGTGYTPPASGKFIATVQMPPMVRHFFEL